MNEELNVDLGKTLGDMNHLYKYKWSNKTLRKENYYITEPNSGCWLWLGHLDSLGYGRVRIQGRSVGAHRYFYSMYKGSIPEGLHVLHVCDVRCCVNPNHLFLGSHSDNMQDMYRKGRGNRPCKEKHYNSKLSSEDVIEIKDRYKSGNVTQCELASEFGVTQANIGYIVRGESWI